ncbi:hypothetical protein D3877_11340 [Azospirillum cavernae]|uniref:HTH luxR-type domain-containing protein n=1 Tax=Azospirillum cavernae TaxID=2320860 RepID=A0A418W4V3_9PROT|nr:response regulator transcription factor [Azospirillum cavernae]RJF85035.1 hypothetical protein D3877_11340 [Azospirillum cavernae]
MTLLSALPPLPPHAVDLIQATDKAGGAIIVFDREDHIIGANHEQRRIMPCSAYGPRDTYRSLFWSLYRSGLTGNKGAKADPATWLANTVAARHSSPNLDFVNSYPWGRMLVSHLRLDDGTSIQARLDMKASGVDRYFGDHDAGMGVMWAVRVQREMRGLQSALDNLGLAVALVDSTGMPIHQNAAFGALLDAADGLTLASDGSVMALDDCDDLVLRQTLGHVATGAVPSCHVPLRRPGRSPLIMAVSSGTTPETAVLAVARDGEDDREIATVLMRAFDLSPVEAEVLAALGAGLSVREIARRRGVAEGTTYLQVKAVKVALERFEFAATDLATLASLVTRISAITRAPRPRAHDNRRLS